MKYLHIWYIHVSFRHHIYCLMKPKSLVWDKCLYGKNRTFVFRTKTSFPKIARLSPSSRCLSILIGRSWRFDDSTKSIRLFMVTTDNKEALNSLKVVKGMWQHIPHLIEFMWLRVMSWDSFWKKTLLIYEDVIKEWHEVTSIRRKV